MLPLLVDVQRVVEVHFQAEENGAHLAKPRKQTLVAHYSLFYLVHSKGACSDPTAKTQALSEDLMLVAVLKLDHSVNLMSGKD